MEPAKVATVPIYAGDDKEFPEYKFSTKTGSTVTPRNLVTEGWTDWAAQWKPKGSTERLDLVVDTSQAASGIILVKAPTEVTRAMNGPGSWDLQAKSPTLGVQTFVYGPTGYTADVTINADDDGA